MKNLSLNKKRIGIIGSGFSGLTSSAILASKGYDVHVFEKNSSIGGRATHFNTEGFMFDTGPSWYWMPDVFERYFNIMGEQVSDYYELKKLDPGFQVIFSSTESYSIPSNFDELCQLFEDIEIGSAAKLKDFLAQAEYKYQVGMTDLVYKPANSISEFASMKLLMDVLKLQVFSSFSKHVRSFFKDPRLLAIIEFPVLFLGAMPKHTPALYSLMNHAGLKQGTFYPMGGFAKVIQSFHEIAVKHGVQFHLEEPIQSINISSSNASSLRTPKQQVRIDAVIASADYHHVESQLLPKEFRMYDETYWDKKTFAPSSLIFYLGVNKKVEKLQHHNLFFDEDFEQHSHEIYTNKKWPENPLFYVCCPSKTDASVAPIGCENLFILIPIAVDLVDSDNNTEFYFQKVMKRLEAFVGESIHENIIYKKSYSVENFKHDYNAYKGNAYGLANTLLQTAIFKPKIKSTKVNNLFFAGQLTVPGPGVPPTIISGQIAAKQLINFLNK